MSGDRLVPNDPLLTAALELAPTQRLAEFPCVEPLPAQVRLVEAALTRARAAGLRLPTRITPRWVARPRGSGVQHGEVCEERDVSIYLTLDSNLLPDDLERVVYHEAQHIADWQAGLHRTRPRVELEQRAVIFCQQMLAARR